MKKIEWSKATRKQLSQLPARKWDEDVGPIDRLIILPLRRKAGEYLLMDFVAIKGRYAIYRLSAAGSEVLNIDGIGGAKRTEQKAGWGIDCLRASGLLCLFFNCRTMQVGPSLTDFEVWGNKQLSPALGEPRT